MIVVVKYKTVIFILVRLDVHSADDLDDLASSSDLDPMKYNYPRGPCCCLPVSSHCITIYKASFEHLDTSTALASLLLLNVLLTSFQ